MSAEIVEETEVDLARLSEKPLRHVKARAAAEVPTSHPRRLAGLDG